MNKSIKILINYFLGPLILLILCWSLYRQLIKQPDLEVRWQQLKESWSNTTLWLVCLLMFVNWGIEARKWQLLVSHVQKFSFFKAFKSVLSGCSVSMLTPNRVGEYGGRILYVEEGNRIKAVSLTIVGSISQMLVTLVMGCLGLVYLRYFSHTGARDMNVLPDFWGNILLYLSVGVTIVLLMFYLRLGWLVRTMEKVPAFQKIVKHISVLDEFSGSQLVRILSLSLGRFLIFVLQYILLLRIMHVDISLAVCFWLITVFYLVLAMAPTIGLLELPVRAKASVVVMGLYSANTLGIETAALGIWIINLVVPSLIGSLLILGIKIMKEK